MAIGAVQIQWGWGVLLVGALLLFVAAFSQRRQIYSLSDFMSMFPSTASKQLGGRAGALTSADAGTRAGSPQGRTEDLLKLAELLRSGLITTDEYAKLKSELLKD